MRAARVSHPLASGCWYPARVKRGLAFFLGTLAVGACSFDSTGVGSSSSASPGNSSEDGDATASEGGGTTAGAGSASEGVDEGSTGASVEHPSVEISDGPSFAFGSSVLGEPVEHAFTITNEGLGEATALQIEDLGGPLSVSHDCGEVLAPSASCEARVTFTAQAFGDYAGELKVGFQDAGVASSVSRPLTARGTGVTENLLINGGGEEGMPLTIPPEGWMAISGPNWSSNANPPGGPLEGARTISAGWGPPRLSAFTLQQRVPVASLTTWADAEGVRFHYRAFHRAQNAGDDPTWVILSFHDAAGAELEVHSSPANTLAAWVQSEGEWVAPPNTHRVQMLLVCERLVLDVCSGYFDGVEVWAQWDG